MQGSVTDEEIVTVARIAALMAIRRAPAVTRRESVEDVGQEAALGAVKAARRYQSDSGAGYATYASRVAFGSAVDSFRRKNYPKPTEMLSQTHAAASPEGRAAPVVGRLLAELPSPQRIVIVLIYRDDLTQREIGERMGISVRRVVELRDQAFRALRDYLLPRYDLRELVG